MSLPEAWVERIFARLTLVYGHQFLSRWDGLDMAAVKAAWSHDLATFQQHPRALWWALENLPAGKPPPTSLEFRQLARLAPPDNFGDPSQQRLDAPRPKADPTRVAAELEKLRSCPHARRGDSREWAREIVARHRAGDKATPTVLRIAEECLALEGGRP